AVSPEELNRLWRDPKHWSFWCYKCSEDPRIIVRKRYGMGWTVNFGHPRGLLALVVLIALVLVPPVFTIVTKGPYLQPGHIAKAIGVSIVMTYVFCLYFSRPPRDPR